jgi:hypothetical protein
MPKILFGQYSVHKWVIMIYTLWNQEYMLIHKYLQHFRHLRYSSRNGHAEGEHVNGGRDTPMFCPTLQVLDMSTLGDAAEVNPVIKFLPRDLPCVARTWLQDWHLPRHQGWTYRVPVRYDRNLSCLSLCWHAPLRRDHPGYYTAEVGNSGGTYELPCIFAKLGYKHLMSIEGIQWERNLIRSGAPKADFQLHSTQHT